MLNRLQRWLAGTSASTWDLSGYPPFALPHPGAGRALSDAQAQENWACFEATLPVRQQQLREWLLAHGGPDAQAPGGAAYAQALNQWAKAHWAQLPAFDRLPPHTPWPACPRSGPFIVNSLLGDLAASLGEAIRHANAAWRWGLNLDAADLADDMATSRRVVLIADLARPAAETSVAVLDLEAMVFAAHRFPQATDFVHLTPWATTVADAIAGRYHDY